MPGHEPAGCCHDDHRHDQQTSKYVHGLDHGQAGSSPSGGLISDWASTSETGDEAEDTQSKERVNLVLQEHKGGQDDEFGEHAGHGSERRSELSGCSLDDVDDRLDSRADCVRPGAAPTVSGLALGASSCDDRGRGPEDRGLADLVARRRKRASVLAPKGRGGPVAEAGRLLPGGPSWSDWKEQA